MEKEILKEIMKECKVNDVYLIKVLINICEYYNIYNKEIIIYLIKKSGII